VAVQPHSSSGNGIAKFLERKNRPETKPPHNLQARSGERTAVGRFFLQDRQSLVPVVISLSNARSPNEPIDVARARKFDERLQVGINFPISTGQAGHTPEMLA
jgi:hypothetical protein